MNEISDNIIFKKKPLSPTLNKLFISWVEEMLKEASKNKHQSYHTFKKALAAIKKYPIPLKSGKDCAILEGFGEKICATLDKKLAEFAKTKGLSIRKALKYGNKELCINSKKNSVQTFLPMKGSGSYSIIFALNELTLITNSPNNGFVKKEILDACKKYYQYSPLDSDDKEISWHNMKTLTSKEYVIKNGKSYIISESGKKLFRQLKKLNKTSTTNGGTQAPVTEILPTINVEDSRPLELYYCKYPESSSLEMVNLKADAVSKIENSTKYFRVKIKRDNLAANMDYLYDFNTQCDDAQFIYVFLGDKDAPSKGYPVKETNAPCHNVLNAKALIKPTKKLSEMKVPQPPTMNNVVMLDLQRSNTPVKSSMPEPITPPLYTMTKQSFEIILIVDTRENYGVGKFKDLLCPKLGSNGINFEIRPLPVGDFLWIARDSMGREAVLDIIVERKRFDDLCASIMDNRFKDQKLRMKRLGISRILYLVEKCPSMKNLKIELVSLYQSLVNSEINDYCDVKVTENGADTIAYLSMLSRKLSQIYSNQEIEIYDCLQSPTGAKVNPFEKSLGRRLRGLEYSSFAQSSQKTKPLKVSEMFAKHLMCITGVTPEKAKAVIEMYHSPRVLIEAYKILGKDSACWSLFSDSKLSGNKKFGLAASKAIYCAYTKK